MHSNAVHTSSDTKKPDAFVCVVNPSSLSSSSQRVGGLDVGSLWASARTEGATKALESRVVYGRGQEVAALVSVGVDSSKKQMLDSKREVVRKAAGKGVGLLRELACSGNAAGVKEVGVGLVGVEEDWHAAGE